MTAPIDFLEVPASALCGEVIALTCKGPDEERSYVIEYGQQLDPDDYIASTGFEWLAGDSSLTVTNIKSFGKRFRFTLNGGTLNQKSGLTITIPLVSGDIRTLTLAVTIETQGVLQSGTVPVIMGSQGPRGTIIWPYDSDTVPPSNWSPSDTIAVKTGDFVILTQSYEFYTITVANDGTITYALSFDLNAPPFNLPSGTYYVDQDNTVKYAAVQGTLPADVTLNGGVYMAGATTLPTGLSNNGGVIMTDGSVYYPKTWNNNGVLCASGV